MAAVPTCLGDDRWARAACSVRASRSPGLFPQYPNQRGRTRESHAALVQGREDAAQHVVGVAAPVDEAADRLEHAGALGLDQAGAATSQSSPSNARTVSL